MSLTAKILGFEPCADYPEMKTIHFSLEDDPEVGQVSFLGRIDAPQASYLIESGLVPATDNAYALMLETFIGASSETELQALVGREFTSD